MLRLTTFWSKICNFLPFWAPGLVPSPDDTPHTGVDMSTLLLAAGVPEIDVDPLTLGGRCGGGKAYKA